MKKTKMKIEQQERYNSISKVLTSFFIIIIFVMLCCLIFYLLIILKSDYLDSKESNYPKQEKYITYYFTPHTIVYTDSVPYAVVTENWLLKTGENFKIYCFNGTNIDSIINRIDGQPYKNITPSYEGVAGKGELKQICGENRPDLCVTEQSVDLEICP